ETQAALLKMPWVARAEIKRVWPDRLIISLVERQPVAVWYGNGKEGSPEAFLIDRAGRVLSRLHQERGAVDAAELVQLTGIGARPRLSDVFALTDAVPELRELRPTYVRVGDRRWTLRFATGAEILLPVKNAASTLSRFAKVAALGDLASTDIFDLRVPGRYIHRTRQVRWSGLARGSRATSGGTN
ncbi:MAG: cell division protein FtsQ/DivIB, partial [Pseudomonadota bacterium]